MSKTNINWEQRRYEVAKDVAAACITKMTFTTSDSVVQIAVKIADALIEELKKK